MSYTEPKWLDPNKIEYINENIKEYCGYWICDNGIIYSVKYSEPRILKQFIKNGELIILERKWGSN